MGILWKSLEGFYRGFVGVLWGFCGGFVRVLWGSLEGFLRAFEGFCGGFVGVLWGFCGGFVRFRLRFVFWGFGVYLRNFLKGLSRSSYFVGKKRFVFGEKCFV